MCQAKKLRAKYRRELLLSVFSFCFAFRLCVNIVLNKNFHCGNVGSSCNKGTMYIKGVGSRQMQISECFQRRGSHGSFPQHTLITIILTNAPPFRVILLLHAFFKVSWISGWTFTRSGINPAGRITTNSISSSSSPLLPILTKAAKTQNPRVKPEENLKNLSS